MKTPDGFEDLDEVRGVLDNAATLATVVGSMAFAATATLQSRANKEMPVVGLGASIIGVFVLAQSYLSAFLVEKSNLRKLLDADHVSFKLTLTCVEKVVKHGSNSGEFYKWDLTDIDMDIV